MNKKVIILNGSGEWGKNTFFECCNKYVPSKHISTVDKIKEAYTLWGWNGEKTEQHRKALSDLKDISSKNLDHPINYIQGEFDKFLLDETLELLFVDSREPEEIARFVETFFAITVLIENPRIPKITSNHADNNVDGYCYDAIIENDGTLEDLETKAKRFLEHINEI